MELMNMRPTACRIALAATCLVLPATGARAQVDFASEIRPILQRECIECHGPNKVKGGFRLDSRAAALKGGKSDVGIIPGNSADSPMFHQIEDGDMPPDQPLGPGDVAKIKAWIDQGAKWGAAKPKPKPAVAAKPKPATNKPTPTAPRPATPGNSLPVLPDPAPTASPLLPALTADDDPLDEPAIELLGDADQGTSPDFTISLTPTVGFIDVSGNEQKFREHAWMRDGWTGGIARFQMLHQIDPETSLTAEGSVIAPDNLEFSFDLERQGVGFIRGGVEHFTRYYNDVGGYHAPFAAGGQPAFQLDRNLHLDHGRFWTEVGITRREWPEITLGYEYRFRNGMKPTLHWGPITQGFETRNIYPAYKDINEDVHIFTADLRHTWNDIHIENNFIAEFTDLRTRRFEASPDNFGPSPDIFTTIDESHDAVQLTNTFSLQKEFNDWFVLSGGYYYSRLDSDAALAQSTIDSANAFVFGQQWTAQPITLDWHAHMLNVSTRVGPWNGFTVAGGIQSNWERQSAIGDATLFFGIPDPMVPIPGFFSSSVSSSKQSFSIRENASLRYDRIPHTVLFAEAEIEHESTDYFEQDNGDFQGFIRDTGSSSRDQDYRLGFTLSPSHRWSLNAHYRYREQADRYDHLVDTFAGGFPNDGYSAFITGRDQDTHELKARLQLRPAYWLQANLTYQMQSTDYSTDTDPVAFGAPSDTPGGWILAGEYEADVYGLNLVLTPWEKLSLNSSFTYHDSHTRTASNGDAAVENYEGGTITAYLGGRYVIDEDTEISAGYGYARGDFSQGNAADGLPLGIEYEQHSLQATLSTRLTETVSTQLQYRFQQYDEPTAGGLNDYTAHGLFANVSFAW